MLTRKLGWIVAGALCALWANVALAKSTKDYSIGDSNRFASYEDSFLLYNRMSNNGWADNDEWALRAHYSFGYVLYGRDHYDLLFTYTGEFDFYINSRDSGPVINRVSNPAMHFRFETTPNNSSNSAGIAYDIGVEHESDGQVIDVTSARGREVAQNAYAIRDRFYFDQISRGSNFVSLMAKVPEGVVPVLPITLEAKLRAYLSQDYDVTWGPRATEHAKLSDYNVLSLRARYSRPYLGIFEAKWTIGEGGFKDQSFDASWQLDVTPDDAPLSIPIYVRYHYGPLNTLSNYTQRQDSIGIGVRFAGF